MRTKKTLLIVEDEQLIAEDLKDIVLALGYDVAGIADNSATAIALAKEKSPDLITMDVTLSGPVDGISTVELIRKESDVPVIYITVFTTDSILERAKKTKPSGYIIKPFNERQVRTAIEIALHNFEIERKVTEANALIRALVNATANPLFLIDTSGTILMANEAMAGRAVRDIEQLQGMHIHQLLESGVITEQLETAVLTALEGTAVRFEESFQDSWYDNLCIPVKVTSGRVLKAAVFCNDITFLKKTEDQLRTLNERLIGERIALNRTQEELRFLNIQLEEKVRDRTAQLETSNVALIEQNRTLQIANAGIRALMSVQEEARFIPQICRNLLQIGGYAQVWLASINADGTIGITAAAGDESPTVIDMLDRGHLPVCAEAVQKEGTMRSVISLDPSCAGCPLSLLHMDRSTIIVRLDAMEKTVGVLGVTLKPGISPANHEAVRLWQVAQEIAFAIVYLRTKEREQRAYWQITRNLEQLAILNDHIRNPLQGIIGYAGMGEGEIFEKIITLSTVIDSIVTKLDEGYLESKKIHDYLILHGEVSSTYPRHLPPRKNGRPLKDPAPGSGSETGPEYDPVDKDEQVVHPHQRKFQSIHSH